MIYYDLYLQTVCRAHPDLDDLLEVIPRLATADVQSKLKPVPFPPKGVLRRHPPRPGFLGLSLPQAQAHELSRRLAIVRAQGEILPVAYRSPKVTRQQAQQIAERELYRVCQRDYPGYTFEPVRPWKEEVRTWVFYTASKQMQEEQGVGFGTGGPMVSVDKVDGHIWQNEEIQERGKEVF